MTNTRPMTLALAFLLTTSLCHGAWERTDNALAYQVNGKSVWQLNFSQTNDTKPHFSILSVVDGPNLVCTKPKDHPWHYGLWFSWKFINGINYWEEKNGKAEGKTAWDPPAIERQEDGSASVAFAIRYGDLLTESRTLAISKPEADGGYFIDWDATFTALADVKLDRYLPWGGYAGISVRLSQALTNVSSVTAHGLAELKNGQAHIDATAAEMNGVIDGEEYGVAMVADGNWFFICQPSPHNFFYFNDALLFKDFKELKKGESFSLRYCIYVHKGRWNAEQLNKLEGKPAA